MPEVDGIQEARIEEERYRKHNCERQETKILKI